MTLPKYTLFKTLTISLSLILGMLSISVALSTLAEETPPEGNQQIVTVYRADLLSPEDMVQQNGFWARGVDTSRPYAPSPDISLYNHVGGIATGMARDDSGYVSTTTDFDWAQRYIQERLGGIGYIYTIHVTPNFIDVAGTLGHWYRHTEEQEYSALGMIRADQVVGWQRVSYGQAEDLVRNPNYNSRRYQGMSAGGAQPILAGFPNNHRAWMQDPWRQYAECNANLGKKSSSEIEQDMQDQNAAELCQPRDTPLEAATLFIQSRYPNDETVLQGKGSVAAADGKRFQFKAWGGDSNSYWQGQVCLWDNGDDGYAWTYQCSGSYALSNGYNDKLTIHAVDASNDEFQITSGNTCLLSTEDTSSAFNAPGYGTTIYWGTDCATTNQNSIWHWISEDQIADQYDQLLGFSNSLQLYWAAPYGTVKVSRYHPKNRMDGKDWTQWHLHPVD